jgi:hypothetical protein
MIPFYYRIVRLVDINYSIGELLIEPPDCWHGLLKIFLI